MPIGKPVWPIKPVAPFKPVNPGPPVGSPTGPISLPIRTSGSPNPNPGQTPNLGSVRNFPGGQSSYYPPDPRNPFSYLINQTAPTLSYGGVLASTAIDLFPMVDLQGNTGFYTFDPTQGFNDLYADSIYFFRVEDIAPYRTPTIRWVILTYINLGPVTVTLNLTGCTDKQSILSKTQVCKLGNTNNIGSVMTFRQSMGEAFSAMNLQLSIFRKAGDGPISLSHVSLVGSIEETNY